jgi:glycosyltransferase involved in cell wall biosynthesis
MLFGPGGGETHLWHLSSELAKQGAEITIVSRYADPTTPVLQHRREIPVRFVSTPFARNRRLYRLSTIWALLMWPLLLDRAKYDVVYTWELSPFTKFLTRFVRKGGRMILQRTGEPMSPKEWLDPDLVASLDGLLVETPIHAKAARRGLKLPLPILALPVLGHYSAPRRNGRSPNGTFRLAFLGRYHRDKGLHRLLEIWPKLNVGKAELNCYAWGPGRDLLAQRVRERGLEDQIRFNAPYSTPEELSAIMAQTDLLVLPSETEGLPVVLLEAMAHGVPFVATDVGAVRTLAEDNPDVRVTALENREIRKAIEEMAGAIRAGRVCSDRLQAYYESRYSYQDLAGKWCAAFLDPEEVWTRAEML